MDVRLLRSLLNTRVELSFKDGELVEALLLGADPERDRDITYQVIRVIKKGSPLPRGSEVGATCVASLSDLADCRSMR
jgi:hypothetical protein